MSRQIFDVENKYEIIEGFSARLNELLDKCGYAPSGEGRGRELIEFFNISKGSATLWLTKDKPPVWATLNTLVEKLIAANHLNFNQDRVVAWLMHSGNVIENPLETIAKPRSQRLLDAVIYSELEKLAKQYGVDIFGFSQTCFDRLYQKVLTYFEENKLTAPNDLREADHLILGGYLLLAQADNATSIK
jgi:hypothetical protein